MAVDTFDPGALNAGMDPAAVAEILALADGFEADELDLTELQVKRFAPLITHQDWSDKASECSLNQIRGLIRIFTLGEMQYPDWKAEDKSAVIPLVRVLKQQHSYDKEMTRWIKAHTDNRFLPHGSLLDRL